jgi:hypothetical protein
VVDLSGFDERCPIPRSALEYHIILGGYRTDMTEQQLKDTLAFSGGA